jgi:hypothetical protein
MAGIDAYTKLLLHLDNNIDDSELTQKTVTNNNVTFSDTVKKWGYSGVFNGANAYLSIPDSTDFDFNLSTSYTIEYWIYPNAVESGTVLHGRPGGSTYDGGENYGIIGGGGSLVWGSINGQWNSGNTVSSGSWQHIAFVYDAVSKIAYCFVNGVGVSVSVSTVGNSSGTLYFGKKFNAPYDFNGYMDEIRFSKGIARWTSNFTTPIEPYSLDSKPRNQVLIIA